MATAKYLLIWKGKWPGDYYSRPAGERLLVRAFINDYLMGREEG